MNIPTEISELAESGNTSYENINTILRYHANAKFSWQNKVRGGTDSVYNVFVTSDTVFLMKHSASSKTRFSSYMLDGYGRVLTTEYRTHAEFELARGR